MKNISGIPTLRLEEFLPYRLVRAAEAVSLDFSRIYKEKHGLSRPEWRVLATLAQFGRATATDIGAHSAMHKTKVSRAVFELESRRWLARKADEKDRRVEWLELTKMGRNVFATLAAPARDYEAKLFAMLGKDSAKHLISALEKLERLNLPKTRHLAIR
jgi:DNA-binding MarR family transcriptional regulator